MANIHTTQQWGVEFSLLSGISLCYELGGAHRS